MIKQLINWWIKHFTTMILSQTAMLLDLVWVCLNKSALVFIWLITSWNISSSSLFQTVSYLYLIFISNTLDFKEDCPKPSVVFLQSSSYRLHLSQLGVLVWMHNTIVCPSYSTFSLLILSSGYYIFSFSTVWCWRGGGPSYYCCTDQLYHISVLSKFLLFINNYFYLISG